MGMNTYFDFAEEDYKYFAKDYSDGRVANYMGSIAQNISERYMKHLISEFIEPATEGESQDKTSILRTHSLGKLMKYLEANLDFAFSKETKLELRAIDGFYFTSRYPGEDSYFLDKNDIDSCSVAVSGCRKEIIAYIDQQHSRQQALATAGMDMIIDNANRKVEELNGIQQDKSLPDRVEQQER